MHALVTGGSSGIGAAVATELLARGYRVTLLARTRSKLVATADEIARIARADRESIRIAAADVRDRMAVSGAVFTAEEAFGPCDVLVASAGVARPGRFQDLGEAEFRLQMDTNYHGAVNSVAAVLPRMSERRTGRIAIVASGAALLGIYGHTAYAPTKFALRGFAEALRAEARACDVSVSVCYPPDTDTPLLHENLPSRPPETSAIAGNAGVWSAEDVALQLVAGLLRGQARIIPGWQMKALAALGPLLAPLLHAHFDRVAARAGSAAGANERPPAPHRAPRERKP